MRHGTVQAVRTGATETNNQISQNFREISFSEFLKLGVQDFKIVYALKQEIKERNASSLALATSPACASTRLAFSSPAASKKPARVHATTRAPAAAARATQRLPVLPFAPNTTHAKIREENGRVTTASCTPPRPRVLDSLSGVRLNLSKRSSGSSRWSRLSRVCCSRELCRVGFFLCP